MLQPIRSEPTAPYALHLSSGSCPQVTGASESSLFGGCFFWGGKDSAVLKSDKSSKGLQGQSTQEPLVTRGSHEGCPPPASVLLLTPTPHMHARSVFTHLVYFWLSLCSAVLTSPGQHYINLLLEDSLPSD